MGFMPQASTQDAEIEVIRNAGAPVDGTTANDSPKGLLLVDVTNANLYINTGVPGATVWKLIAHA